MEAAQEAPSFDSPANGTEEEHAPTIVVARNATRSEADALKVKRPVVYRRYADRFDRLYSR